MNANQAERLEHFVRLLADGMEWNWTRGCSQRDAADRALKTMADLGLIEYQPHPLGGHTWIVNGKAYGRTDGIEAPTIAERGQQPPTQGANNG